MRKLIPRKSTRGVKVNTNPKILIAEKESDHQDQSKLAEMEKEKSAQKEKAQKKITIARPATAKKKVKE